MYARFSLTGKEERKIPLSIMRKFPYNAPLMTTSSQHPGAKAQSSSSSSGGASGSSAEAGIGKHLTDIESLSPETLGRLLDLAARYAGTDGFAASRARRLEGRTVVNLFMENSTRTRTSFELAGGRLGAYVVSMVTEGSSVKKGESLIDTAETLNAMAPDVLVVRHSMSGAATLLAQKLDCSVINAGDGSHEHPTQALLDALTIRRRLGTLQGKRVVICGDILNSRVARSNIHLLTKMGAQVELVGPPTLMPARAEAISQIGGAQVNCSHHMEEALKGCDVVMMLRLQLERMTGQAFPSPVEYAHLYGLDEAKLAHAKPDVLVMHPGPMNRGVEIDGVVADDMAHSVIREQVAMGVAVRMACLDSLVTGGGL